MGLFHDHHSVVSFKLDEVFWFGDGAEGFMGFLYDWSVFSETFNISGFTSDVGSAFVFFNLVFLEDLFELEHLGYHVINVAPGVKLVLRLCSVLSVALVVSIIVVESIAVISVVVAAATAKSSQK